MSTVVYTMFLFALAGAISPGPVNLIAASLGVRRGFVGALPHVAGASLGYTAIVWLMGSGFNSVLLAYPQAADGMRYAGAAYLLYLCVRIAAAPPAGPAQAMISDLDWWAGVLQGALAQTLNPKSWLWALSGVGLFVADRGPAALLLFCTISGLVCFASVASWAGLGRMAGPWLARPRAQLVFNRSMALLLALTVVAMLATT